MLKLNIGLSYPEQFFMNELEKLKLASQYNIDYVSVISVDKPRIKALWESVQENIDENITLCSVPIYESIIFE